MRKFRFLTAALCVAVLLCGFTLTAYADGGEEWESVEAVEKEPVQSSEPTPDPTPAPTVTPSPEPAPTTEAKPTVSSSKGTGNTGSTVAALSAETAKQETAPVTDTTEGGATGGLDWEGLDPANLLTPDGQGTVVDNATDDEGKEFFTITTEDESVFYLIIDHQKSGNNVYFLNTVTVADLLTLAEKNGEDVSAVIAPTATEEPDPEPTVSDDPEPEPEAKTGGNMGMLLIALAVVAVGGGAGWYFKIYRPKQQRAADLEEDYPDEAEPDYGNSYGDYGVDYGAEDGDGEE